MPQAEARRQLGMDPNERLVLFVGRPHQARKRGDLARAAVELLNERMPARLVVAWKVEHAQVPLYMNACDALIFTSMPTSRSEAWMSGTTGSVPPRTRSR